jgi:hypothetical protein
MTWAKDKKSFEIKDIQPTHVGFLDGFCAAYGYKFSLWGDVAILAPATQTSMQPLPPETGFSAPAPAM